MALLLKTADLFYHGNTFYVFELDYLGNPEFYFSNWIEDENPPSSSFNDSREHQVIDTELVSLELKGNSQDSESGVKEADLAVYQLGGAESVQDYPARSFFDVFNNYPHLRHNSFIGSK